MNLEDMLKSLNPKALSGAIAQMQNILSPQQMKQVQQVIETADKSALNQKLNHLSQADFQKELQKNPALAKQLANNPEVMQKLNQVFENK